MCRVTQKCRVSCYKRTLKFTVNEVFMEKKRTQTMGETKSGEKSVPATDTFIIKLHVLTNQYSQTQRLEYTTIWNREKSSKSSNLRSWNQQIICICIFSHGQSVIGWIAMKFNADIFGTKMMNPSYFGDPLDFLLELNHQVKILVYDQIHSKL